MIIQVINSFSNFIKTSIIYPKMAHAISMDIDVIFIICYL